MKILVVDDSEEFISLISKYLNAEFKDVEIIVYPNSPIIMPEDNFPWSEYDVLLLDYNLGKDQSGFEWLKKFNNAPSFPSTIVLTAVGDEYIAVQAIKLGAADYLNKIDITPLRLAEAIQIALNYTQQEIEREKKETLKASQIVSQIYENSHTFLPGNDNVGYRCIRRIGQGAMSQIYLAERKKDRRSMALKLLFLDKTVDKMSIRRFLREAEIASHVKSKFVVNIFDSGLTDEYAFIAIEFCSRGSLRQRMDLNIPLELALKYIIHTSYGLNEIHKYGIIHRDLKPANIMFRSNDSLALADFGIAKNLHDIENWTVAGTILGTPNYMSPEQGQGFSLDARSDIYSVGVMFYELIAGQKPFIASTPAAAVYKHVYEDVPPLPKQLNKFQDIVDMTLAKNPDYRFQSAKELINALEACT